MNQEKIGKFIKELRKEKDMTQEELADKLGVTNKSISKWETGRCLMDLSLIKPLCQVLDISVLELLNGERIKADDINVISNETLEKTLLYTKKEIKRNKKKTVILMLIFFIVLLISGYFIYQSYNLMRYSTDKILNDYMQNDIEGNLTQNGTVAIYKKTIPEEEYMNLGNIKIKDFLKEISGLTYYEPQGKYGEYSKRIYHFSAGYNTKERPYPLLFFAKGIAKDITVVGNTYLTDFFDEQLQINLREYYLDNNLNDEIDIIEDFKEKGYQENNIFTSVEKMKFNLEYNNERYYTAIYLSDSGYTLIEGDYRGIYDEIEIDDISYPLRRVRIFKDKAFYHFEFLDERFTKEAVLEIISTLEIR